MLCIGNSHLGCVLAAAAERDVALEAVFLNGVPRSVQPRLASRVIAAGMLAGREPRALVAAAPRVFVFVGGLDHNMLGLREHPVPFDVVLPEAPQLPLAPGAEVLPYDALRAVLVRRMQPQLDTLRQVAASANGDVFLFASPPPPAANWLALHEKRFARLAAAYEKSGKRKPDLDRLLLGTQLRHSRFVRFKLWRLDAQIVADAAAELGVRIVPVPTATTDEEGFLRAEFCADPIHANAAYGALVLDQLGALT